MPLIVDALLYGWDKNAGYAGRLLADVPEDKIVYQPSPGMNHPAWVFSHLNIYHPVIAAMLTGKPFEDPKGHKFGMQSKPTNNPADYPTKQQLLDTFLKGHADVAAALRSVGDAKMAEPPALERWRAVMPTYATLLSYLLHVHESTHLGQISVWRRVQGLPAI